MLRDRQIWCSALLVASFNIMAFSYFSLAPFIFETLGLTSEQFGYSGIVLAFGLAIPNILSQALKHYRNRLGAAGAVLGLLYYLLIAGGLALAAMGQHLPLTLLGCSLLSLACSARLKGYAES